MCKFFRICINLLEFDIYYIKMSFSNVLTDLIKWACIEMFLALPSAAILYRAGCCAKHTHTHTRALWHLPPNKSARCLMNSQYAQDYPHFVTFALLYLLVNSDAIISPSKWNFIKNMQKLPDLYYMRVDLKSFNEWHH